MCCDLSPFTFFYVEEVNATVLWSCNTGFCLGETRLVVSVGGLAGACAGAMGTEVFGAAPAEGHSCVPFSSIPSPCLPVRLSLGPLRKALVLRARSWCGALAGNVTIWCQQFLSSQLLEQFIFFQRLGWRDFLWLISFVSLNAHSSL